MNNTEWVSRMGQMREDGERLQKSALAAQAEINEILAAHAPVSAGVVVELDGAGVVAALTLPDGITSTLSAEELGREVVRAISAAVAEYRAARSTGIDVRAPGFDLDALMGEIFSGVGSAPERFTNDFKTLTIVTLRSEIVAVELESRWAASTRLSSIAEEIVRMARIAAGVSIL